MSLFPHIFLSFVCRRLALQWHPDKNAHQSELAAECFKEIHNAYAVLNDGYCMHSFEKKT